MGGVEMVPLLVMVWMAYPEVGGEGETIMAIRFYDRLPQRSCGLKRTPQSPPFRETMTTPFHSPVTSSQERTRARWRQSGKGQAPERSAGFGSSMDCGAESDRVHELGRASHPAKHVPPTVSVEAINLRP